MNRTDFTGLKERFNTLSAVREYGEDDNNTLSVQICCATGGLGTIHITNRGFIRYDGLDHADVPPEVVKVVEDWRNDNMGFDSTKDINKVIKNDIKKLAKDITKKRISDKKSKLGKKILGEVEKKFQINVSEPKKSKDHKKSDK